MRPELRDGWDLRVYLHVSPPDAVRRALVRDADLLGGAGAVRERYHRRYLPDQRLYRQHCEPTERADVVVDNDARTDRCFSGPCPTLTRRAEKAG